MEVWTDLTCPWCYLGKRRLERAVHAFEHPHAVQVRYRSFERDAAAVVGEEAAAEAARGQGGGGAGGTGPAGRPRRTGPHLRRAPADAPGEAEGGPALQAAVAERMFAAHFCEGKALDDPRVLQRIAPEAGLDEHRVAAVLAGDEYASAVREDEREAARLQLASLPFVLADRRIAVAGPQPVEALLGLLRQAWEAREAGGSAG